MDKQPSTSKIAQLEKETLKRDLGVWDLFSVGYGDLGSSIYYALGITAFFALGAAPISLFLAGLVFICTALTYAEMTSAFGGSGGSANFARAAFNDLISFIAGWGLLLDYIVTIAISIFSVGAYLVYFFPIMQSTGVNIGLSIGLIALLFVMNFFGTKYSTRISFILTAFTLVTQVIVILIALVTAQNIGEVFSHFRINTGASWSPSWTDFWKGTAMAMVAYTGIESIAALGSETKEPKKTLPRAVIIVMFVLIAMYLGISMAGLSTMTPQELGKKYVTDPLAGIVANLPFGSAILGPWIGLLASALLFVAGNAGLLGASRLSFNMGEFYQLPRFFYQIHHKFRTPFVALGIFSILASLVILWSLGNLHFLADLYNFGAMIAFFSAHMSLIVLRIKNPDLERSFTVPFNIKFKQFSLPITAIIGALATLSVWGLVVVTKPEGRNLGFAWMGIGIVMYLIYRRKKKIAATGQVQIEKIKVPEYKTTPFQKILVATKGGADTETVQMACQIAKLHHAPLTAIYIIEVPYSIPLQSPLPYRILIGESILQKAEAISREYNVELQTKILRARSIEEGITNLVKKDQFDLLIIGAFRPKTGFHKGIGTITEHILRRAPCRVFVVSSYGNKE